MCDKSKTKIEKVIEDWYKRYPNLQDWLSPKPMIGPAMRINLKSDVEGQRYPRRAMTAVMVPLHFKQASNELVEELLQSKVLRRAKKFCHA